MVAFEELEFFQLVEVILLLFVDELDDFKVFNDRHVHEKTVEDLLIGLEVVVVDLNHQ